MGAQRTLRNKHKKQHAVNSPLTTSKSRTQHTKKSTLHFVSLRVDLFDVVRVRHKLIQSCEGEEDEERTTYDVDLLW